MTHPHEVFVVVHDDQSIEAFDDQDAARNATRDDAAPYVECVPVQYAPQDITPGNRRRTWASIPQLTVPAHWATPDDAA